MRIPYPGKGTSDVHKDRGGGIIHDRRVISDKMYDPVTYAFYLCLD